MKFIKDIPKKLLERKKSQSVPGSESYLASFSSSDDSQTGFSNLTNGSATPTNILPADELSDFELKQAFELIDRDGDEKIKEELEALLIRIGDEPPSQEELRVMLSKVDVDDDGHISLEEVYVIGSAFGPLAVTLRRGKRSTSLTRIMTEDNGGELFNVLRMIVEGRCTLEDCPCMIKCVDKSGDGFVCFEDFTLMMDQQRQF